MTPFYERLCSEWPLNQFDPNDIIAAIPVVKAGRYLKEHDLVWRLYHKLSKESMYYVDLTDEEIASELKEISDLSKRAIARNKAAIERAYDFQEKEVLVDALNMQLSRIRDLERVIGSLLEYIGNMPMQGEY